MTPFLASLLQHLAPRLTPDHVAILADDEYDAPSRILRLTPTEIQTKLGIKGGLAADILDFAEAAKGTDFGKTQATNAATIQTILENLVGADPIRTAAARALHGHQVHFVVVGEDQELLTSKTMALLASPDRKIAESRGLWEDYALVSVDSFLPDTSPLRSPYSPEPLVEGFDAAGIAWGSLSRERLGLAVWAVQEKMDAGRPHAEIFADFQTTSELYNRALKRAKAKTLKMEDLRELAKATVLQASAQPSKTFSTTPAAALHELFVALFDADTLRRFITHRLNLSTAFLGGGSLLSLVDDTIGHLRRHGYIDANLFRLLASEYPRRCADIAAIAAKFSFALA